MAEECPCEEDYALFGAGAACHHLDPITGQRCYRRAGHFGDHTVCGITHSVFVWPQEPGDLEQRKEELRRIGHHEMADRWPI